MIFTKEQQARYDKLIHKGGDHGNDGELWNRHDLHIIIHGLLGKRLTKRAADWLTHVACSFYICQYWLAYCVGF